MKTSNIITPIKQMRGPLIGLPPMGDERFKQLDYIIDSYNQPLLFTDAAVIFQGVAWRPYINAKTTDLPYYMNTSLNTLLTRIKDFGYIYTFFTSLETMYDSMDQKPLVRQLFDIMGFEASIEELWKIQQDALKNIKNLVMRYKELPESIRGNIREGMFQGYMADINFRSFKEMNQVLEGYFLDDKQNFRYLKDEHIFPYCLAVFKLWQTKAHPEAYIYKLARIAPQGFNFFEEFEVSVEKMLTTMLGVMHETTNVLSNVCSTSQTYLKESYHDELERLKAPYLEYVGTKRQRIDP